MLVIHGQDTMGLRDSPLKQKWNLSMASNLPRLFSTLGEMHKISNRGWWQRRSSFVLALHSIKFPLMRVKGYRLQLMTGIMV